MISFKVFCICIVLCFMENRADSNELQYVQILYRHGDRAPIDMYPTDPNPVSVWEQGIGQLTQLGKRQHYNFGKTLRQAYSTFITSDPSEITIFSSKVKRCFESAESNTAAFFAPDEHWEVDSKLPWQPIFINYLPEEDDKYLETVDCPKARKEAERLYNTSESQRINSENKALYEYLSQHSGLDIKNWTDAGFLFDTLYIEKRHNLTVPSWADVYWDQLRNISNLDFYWSFNSPLLLKLLGGPLIGKIVDNMHRKINDVIPREKVHIFSGHDVNVAIVLEALGLFNMLHPPYCAAVVFELYKMDNNHTVRLLYYNSSKPEDEMQTPQVLTLDGCSEYCPLNFFVEKCEKYIPKDFNRECQLATSSISSSSDTFPYMSTIDILGDGSVKL